MKNKKLIISIIVVTFLGIISIFIFSNNSSQKEEFLEKHGLSDLTVEEMVSYLDKITNESSDFSAGVDGDKLYLSDSNNSFTFNTPKDKFYLSFSPYIERTHPCKTHNLVTCQGELVNKTVSVVITDKNGNMIVDDNFTTMDNGFIGIWLPKNITVNITVSYQGLSASNEITTYSSSNTCLTTLKLS